MKYRFVFSAILVFFSYSLSQAACGDESTRTFNGDQAISLTYILKNSAFASKSTSGNTTTWSLANLVCKQTNRGVLPDLMPTYSCTPPSGVGPLAAKDLFDAMSELGVMPDGAAGHVYETAKMIKCKVNTNGAGGTAINPRCSLKAAWGDQCP